MMNNTAYLALGSNIGNRKERLTQARLLLGRISSEVVNQSSLYETEALIKPESSPQNPYLNQVIKIHTELSPHDLLELSQLIETNLGRMEKGDWSARSIDIDILFYNAVIINEPDLKIPHPELVNRPCILIPLYEIAPSMAHPTAKKTVRKLLKECTITQVVTKLT